MKSKATEVDRLAARDYAMQVYRDPESGDWVAEVPDLPGCIGVADTRQDAVSVAQAFIRDWIEEALGRGWDVPEPTERVEASGRFVVRLPRSLHSRLQTAASNESVSLNQLVVSLLSEQLGRTQVFSWVKQALARDEGEPHWCPVASTWALGEETWSPKGEGMFTTRLFFAPTPSPAPTLPGFDAWERARRRSGRAESAR